jgi:hypothetical protein
MMSYHLQVLCHFETFFCLDTETATCALMATFINDTVLYYYYYFGHLLF